MSLGTDILALKRRCKIEEVKERLYSILIWTESCHDFKHTHTHIFSSIHWKSLETMKNSVAVCTHNTQIMVSNYHFQFKRNKSSLNANCRFEAGNTQLKPRISCLTKIKKAFRAYLRHIRYLRSQFEKSLSGHLSSSGQEMG